MSPTDENLLERVAALKHDLGKYVAWRSANLDERSWTEVGDDLIEALQADILRTRTRDGVGEPAWEVWRRLAGDLERPFEHDELGRVDDAVRILADHAGALETADREALSPVVGELRAAQLEIRGALRDLQRALRRGVD